MKRRTQEDQHSVTLTALTRRLEAAVRKTRSHSQDGVIAPSQATDYSEPLGSSITESLAACEGSTAASSGQISIQSCGRDS